MLLALPPAVGTSKTLTRQASVLGSGLSAPLYLGLLATSVMLFVSWGGWMWQATANDSHVGRFAVSYLSVPALAAMALWLTKRFSWPRLATAVGTLWAIKLVVTALLYFAFGPRGGMFGMVAAPVRSSAAQPAESSAPSTGSSPAAAASARATSYEAAEEAYQQGTVFGTVSLAGAPVAGAAVYLVSPRPGREQDEQPGRAIVIASNKFERPLYLAFVGSELSADNHDKSLHRLAMIRPGGGNERNLPLPPGGHASFSPNKPGEFLLSSQSQSSAPITASLLVLDHPYGVITDAKGYFELTAVAAGDIRVAALYQKGDKPLRTQAKATLKADSRVQLQLDLEETQ